MEKHHHIQPFFLRESRIGSIFAYRTFLKKGYRNVQKLIVSMNQSAHRLALHEKSLKNARLVKLFKKTKFVKKLDISQLLSKKRDVDFPTLLYIAKKIPAISSLSINDPRGLQGTKNEGIVTAWPKYSKHLRSLVYHVSSESHNLFGVTANTSNVSKLVTDNVKYLPKLETVQITFPNGEYCGYLKKIWRFKRFPASIRKISLNHVNSYEELGIDAISLAVGALKNLKALEVNQINKNFSALTKSVIGFVPQFNQLQELKIALPEDFDIDDSVCKSIKRLTELKAVKLEILSKESGRNLKILESLEGSNLKYLNLKVTVKDQEDIGILKELLRKNKKSLETLKIRLIKLEQDGGLEKSEEFRQLFKEINNLPQLINFVFFIDIHRMFLGCTCELIKMKIGLKKILSKQIPLRRLRLSFNTFSLSDKSFLTLFDSLKGAATNLEKIEIDFWESYLKRRVKADDALEFIQSLENIRSLKFYGLFGTSEAFFLKLVEAMSGLKYLRTFWIGRISEKIERPVFDECLEKILSKPALETFICLSYGNFETTKRKEGEAGINVKEIKKKNPYFKKAQVGKISVLDDPNPWKDDGEEG